MVLYSKSQKLPGKFYKVWLSRSVVGLCPNNTSVLLLRKIRHRHLYVAVSRPYLHHTFDGDIQNDRFCPRGRDTDFGEAQEGERSTSLTLHRLQNDTKTFVNMRVRRNYRV